MKTSTHICILCVAILASGCASSGGSAGYRRNCSIGLINVPVETLADLRITADSFDVGLDALRGAGQSKGNGEAVHEWWPAMDAPGSIKFLLKFKDGSSVTKQKTIAATHFNRFGISGGDWGSRLDNRHFRSARCQTPDRETRKQLLL